LKSGSIEDQALRETFFYNQLQRGESKLEKGTKTGSFIVKYKNKDYFFRIEGSKIKGRTKPDVYYAVEMIEEGEGKMIPLWLLGFLY